MTPSASTSGLDIGQAVALVGVVFIDSDAQQRVVVVDPDLGEIPRVVADGDVMADKRCQGRADVALALEVDAVSLDSAVGGDPQQESVEFFMALPSLSGHPI